MTLSLQHLKVDERHFACGGAGALYLSSGPKQEKQSYMVIISFSLEFPTLQILQSILKRTSNRIQNGINRGTEKIKTFHDAL